MTATLSGQMSLEGRQVSPAGTTVDEGDGLSFIYFKGNALEYVAESIIGMNVFNLE